MMIIMIMVMMIMMIIIIIIVNHTYGNLLGPGIHRFQRFATFRHPTSESYLFFHQSSYARPV